LSREQTQEIDEALQRGETPEEVAQNYGLTRNGLSFKLLQAGKRIVIYRRLEDTAPVDEPRELAAA
jgi:uncharacterized protein (DUF433 family)